MSSDLVETLTKLSEAQDRVEKAWAAYRGAAKEAHFAAVMGSVIPRVCRPSSTWSIHEQVAADPSLAAAMQGANTSGITEAVEDQVAWTAKAIEESFLDELGSYDPELTLHDPQSRLHL